MRMDRRLGKGMFTVVYDDHALIGTSVANARQEERETERTAIIGRRAHLGSEGVSRIP